MSGKKSSTLAGQRELLREHTNKINELVESITNLENREAKHELDVITSMQYLENRVEELKDELKMLTTEVHVNLDKPYTAMRSTGEYKCGASSTIALIKPKDDIREKLLDILADFGEWYASDGDPHYEMTGEKAIDRILAIVKGE